jgi:hypothetical protein
VDVFAQQIMRTKFPNFLLHLLLLLANTAT